MSVTQTFDEWYKNLTVEEQTKILGHILNTKCKIACEGFHAGPTGLMTKGLFVAPSGSAAKVCPVCGK
ncbi:hypothetical protein ACK323_06650 [Aeromonas enteropelogenes]|uniref:hypothetical protein n=1 Tax=Aeromonas enteropelogenes TaxID=29489 RepID=UPI003988F13B